MSDLREQLERIARGRTTIGGVLTPHGQTHEVVDGADDADLEIGSVTKGFTGLLYVDACERGEVRPGTTLGDLLDLGDSFAASCTLERVSRHASGLPRMPRLPNVAERQWEFWRRGKNPYGDTLEQLLAQARETKGLRRRRSTISYSNLGFELLGHGLGVAAGTTWVDLLQTRILDPIGMTSTYAPGTVEQLRPNAVLGSGIFGAHRDPWVGEALGPAGGIRSTAGDLALFARALLNGEAPGMAALDPVATATREMRIGAAWLTSSVRGRRLTWHNGGTGGTASWFGLDRERGTAAFVVHARLRRVDHTGQSVLHDAAPNNF